MRESVIALAVELRGQSRRARPAFDQRLLAVRAAARPLSLLSSAGCSDRLSQPFRAAHAARGAISGPSERSLAQPRATFPPSLAQPRAAALRLLARAPCPSLFGPAARGTPKRVPSGAVPCAAAPAQATPRHIGAAETYPAKSSADLDFEASYKLQVTSYKLQVTASLVPCSL